MTRGTEEKIALIDMDGTIADYDTALRSHMRALQAPNETSYEDRYTGGIEPDYIEARRKMIQRQPGFWRNLSRLPLGFEVVDDLRAVGFALHVLTKGPRTTPGAWGEKVEWACQHLPDATVTVTGDKSIVYGRVLFDDFPPYFTSWLANRPRGLVISIAHPWNADFAKGGKLEHPNVFRYDGKDRAELWHLIRRAYDRNNGESL